MQIGYIHFRKYMDYGKERTLLFVYVIDCLFSLDKYV